MSAPHAGGRWAVGDEVATLRVRADEIDLFRFSAATWNAHRIHYDRDWALAEGLPGAVVQAHLHGAWFARVARSIAGPQARLRTLAWANRAPVVAGEEVEVRAQVTAVHGDDGATRVELALVERGADGATRVQGTAGVEIPGVAP